MNPRTKNPYNFLHKDAQNKNRVFFFTFAFGISWPHARADFSKNFSKLDSIPQLKACPLNCHGAIF